ncbi:hypothetical protein LS68_006090 [Helicobacter sp. MIT 05-5293]|uniref:methyltransferase n=1 Tax=Helicobacter sp. MIT 05-5293 TaxID=1548149 RepID=UPI00068F30A8|nr:methyltransferase [Helicobacter sp. MIT 05-5293]TLD81035.1 hypothetical protein LS68_006090 [Helicobacter sp. MIT 05-5293]
MFNEKIEKISIAFEQTHHIKGGIPLYESRYKKVLSFHNGKAPVYEEVNGTIRAFFINTFNTPLFGRYFESAFGFYDGLACVSDETGYYHILENGIDAYAYRFAWCGNFMEEACVVKDKSGAYFHINTQGEPLYAERFCYVGDYYYGIASALLDNGQYVHIFKDGSRVHNNAFLSLEPFHKGKAVARDEEGYFHIDKNGNALYSYRFAKLEAFYNGKAFGEDFNGNKIILDEADLQIEVRHKRALDIKQELAKAAFDFLKMQILYAILELDVLENLRDFKTLDLPPYCENLILLWLRENGFINNDKSLTFKARESLAIKPLICYWQDLPFKLSGYLAQSLKENKAYFEYLYGQDYFSYMAQNPKEAQKFSFVSAFYASDYDVDILALHNQKVCDIGCGSGTLLSTIKAKYPLIKAIYADKEDVRINKEEEFIEIDFFKPLHIEADVFVMSRILHDWEDAKAIAILQNIAATMGEKSILYLYESVQDEPSLRGGKIKGLELSFHLLNFLGGRERDLEAFEYLFAQAGLKLESVLRKERLVAVMKLRKL